MLTYGFLVIHESHFVPRSDPQLRQHQSEPSAPSRQPYHGPPIVVVIVPPKQTTATGIDRQRPHASVRREQPRREALLHHIWRPGRFQRLLTRFSADPAPLPGTRPGPAAASQKASLSGAPCARRPRYSRALQPAGRISVHLGCYACADCNLCRRC